MAGVNAQSAREFFQVQELRIVHDDLWQLRVLRHDKVAWIKAGSRFSGAKRRPMGASVPVDRTCIGRCSECYILCLVELIASRDQRTACRLLMEMLPRFDRRAIDCATTNRSVSWLLTQFARRSTRLYMALGPPKYELPQMIPAAVRSLSTSTAIL